MVKKMKAQEQVKKVVETATNPRINTTYRISYLPYVPNAIRNMPFTLYPVNK